MRFMVIVKASKDSEAGKLPSQQLLTAMGKFNEELAKVAQWAEVNRDAVAQVLADATGIDIAAWKRAVQRTDYRVAPLNEGVIEEQQRVADRFHKLGLIPNRIAVRDIVWKWEQRA